MHDWPYKARDLAIAHKIMTQMAALNDGVLRFLDEYREDKETNTFVFRFPPWVGVLVNAYTDFYPPATLIEIMGKVLDELLQQFDSLRPEDAELFRNLVLLALSKNLSSSTLH